MSSRYRYFGLSFFIHLSLLLFFMFLLNFMVSKHERVLEIDLSFFETYEKKDEIKETPKVPDKTIQEERPKSLKELKTNPINRVSQEEVRESKIQPVANLTEQVKEESNFSPSPADSNFSPSPVAQDSNQNQIASGTSTNQPTSTDREVEKGISKPNPDNSISRVSTAYRSGESSLSEKEKEELFIKEKMAVISSIVQKNITYPPIARRMGWEGKVLLGITLREDGVLEDVQVINSSGYDILDKNAIDTVRKVCHLFPKPPVKVRITLPITYRLY